MVVQREPLELKQPSSQARRDNDNDEHVQPHLSHNHTYESRLHLDTFFVEGFPRVLCLWGKLSNRLYREFVGNKDRQYGYF